VVDTVRGMPLREQFPSHVRISPIPYSRSFEESSAAALEADLGCAIPEDFRRFLLAYGSGIARPHWYCARPQAKSPRWWMVNALGVREFDERLPGYVTIGQLWPAGAKTSECLLIIKTEGDAIGSVWSWRDPVRGRRPAPEIVAGSFTTLIQGLGYPPQAEPWMTLIDEADVAGLKRWLEGEANVDGRDPISGYTPIEYAAGVHDPTALLGGVPEDLPLRLAGRAIVQLLLNARVAPGRAIRHAFFARNNATVDVLSEHPLDGLLDADVVDMRNALNTAPSFANPRLRKLIEREHRRRKGRCE
jgi:hypothetical protein